MATAQVPAPNRPRWRVPLRAAGIVALLLVVLTHLPSCDGWIRGCADVAVGLAFPPDTVDHPYGAVRSCRILDTRTDLFSEADGTVFLLLDTVTGAVAVRVDYRNTGLGRQYRAEAVELTTAQTPNLFAAEARQLERSVDGRGGVRTQVWVLHYGDG